ncbi:integrase [Oricola sp.]|uniref:integrase n=1 Tax=Oricola sp. TaxID=1979950 RepID=UPI003BAC4EF7
MPKEFEHLDKRRPVRISTTIAVADDPRGVHATEVVKQLDAELEAYWRNLRDGRSDDARTRFEAAQRRIRSFGLTYKTADEIAAGPIADLVSRVQILLDRGSVEDGPEVAALLGGEPRIKLQLSDLLAEFENLQSASLAKMSRDQLRIWRNTRRRAIANLTDIIGDKALSEVTRDDTMRYRLWWQQRIIADGRDIGTANKEIGQLSKMFKTVDRAHQLHLTQVFAELRIEGEEDKSRAAFTAKFVQKRILAPDALADLNDEARDLILIVADTGLRPVEACNLGRETIWLSGDTPHVRVRPIGRTLKTRQSERDIPLVGCALEAAMRHPDGFPRYRDKSSSLSGLVNKFMLARGLRPTPAHSLYSLRHTFEDRLTAVEAPEKVIASLMGHKWIRPKYGAGPSLEQKQSWLARIAFTPPGHG